MSQEAVELPFEEPQSKAVGRAGIESSAAVTIALFCLVGFLIFGRLGGLPLLDPDEGRNAEVAREMSLSRDWLVPTYNGVPYLDKPALYFFAVALSFSAFGVNEFAARLPSALAAVALLILGYRFCRAEFNGRVATFAVLVIGTMPLFQAFAGIVIFDMPLALFVCSAIFASYSAERSEGSRRSALHAVGAVSAGVATLIKGPVGFVLPSIVLTSFALWTRDRGMLRRVFRPINLAVFAAVVLPWFIAVSLRRPDFPYYGLIKETLERFTTPSFQRAGPLYYYVPVLLGVCFGWSALFFEGVVDAWRRRHSWARADRFLLAWIVGALLLFSLSSSKLPGYVLTVVVALGIWIARLFDRALADPQDESVGMIRRGIAVLSLMAGIGAVWISLDIWTPETLSVFRISGTDYRHVRESFPTLLPFLTAASVLCAVAYFSRNTRAVVVCFFAFQLGLFATAGSAIRAYGRDASSRNLYDAIRPLVTSRTVVACLECFPTGLAFYLQRPITLLTRDGHETTSNYIPFYLERETSWPPQFLRVSDLDRFVAARSHRLLLLGEPRQWPKLRRLARETPGDLVQLDERWWLLVLDRKP